MHFTPNLFGDYLNRAKQIIGRIPCYGMAAEVFSGSFDSTSLGYAVARCRSG